MFIVVTKMSFDPDIEDEIVKLTRLGAPIARKQPGLRSFTQHISHDRSHVMTYWMWESETDHLNCMDASDWDEFNPKWEALQASGKMNFELNTYEVLET